MNSDFKQMETTMNHKYTKQCATSLMATEIQSENVLYKIIIYVYIKNCVI